MTKPEDINHVKAALVTWLRAQLDDDERMANAAAQDNPAPWQPGRDERDVLDGTEDRLAWCRDCPTGGVYDSAGTAAHIIRHDPDRVLADVAAKRQHIARWEHVNTLLDDTPDGIIRNELLSVRRAYSIVIADDATVYADRPGYRDELETSMSEPAKCPVCHPVRYDDPEIREMSLLPEACPARANHETITRAFAFLGRIEAGTLTSASMEAAASVRERIAKLQAVKPPAPMAMRITKCEQMWVDDVRAGREHTHLTEIRELIHNRIRQPRI